MAQTVRPAPRRQNLEVGRRSLTIVTIFLPMAPILGGTRRRPEQLVSWLSKELNGVSSIAVGAYMFVVYNVRCWTASLNQTSG